MNYKIDNIIHSESDRGTDYTLCGLSLQPIEDTFAEIGAATETNKKITCEDCLSIIYFCKKLKI